MSLSSRGRGGEPQGGGFYAFARQDHTHACNICMFWLAHPHTQTCWKHLLLSSLRWWLCALCGQEVLYTHKYTVCGVLREQSAACNMTHCCCCASAITSVISNTRQLACEMPGLPLQRHLASLYEGLPVGGVLMSIKSKWALYLCCPRADLEWRVLQGAVAGGRFHFWKRKGQERSSIACQAGIGSSPRQAYCMPHTFSFRVTRFWQCAGVLSL